MLARTPKIPLTENDIQRTVFKHLRQRGAPGIFAFHPKNGGIHQKGRRRGINAGLGVVSGVPDVFVFRCDPSSGILTTHVYALELKTEKGKADAMQRDVLQALRAVGARVAVTYGFEAAIRQLEEWGLLKGRMT